MDKLEEINRADTDRAILVLLPFIERAPLIAQRVAVLRPFDSAEALGNAIRDELFGLNEEERLQLFRAHPELAPVNPLSMTEESQSEQGRLNLTSKDSEFKMRLDELNSRYRDKFGFPFITALVRHKNMESVFAEFETRLESDYRSELDLALEQVAAVSLSRVRTALDDGDSQGRQVARVSGALGWGGEIGGVILLVLSVIFMVGGWQLGLGVPTRLGTGAFPFISGLILAILAIAICIEERRGDGIAERPDWIALLAICAALAVFAVTADRIGLVPGAFLTVIVASFADNSLSIRGKAILGSIVSLACWGLFIELLNLPFKPFVGL